MEIKTFNQNSMGQNVYLYYSEAHREGILIDAGCSEVDIKSLEKCITGHEITVKAMLLTHGHYDHITAISAIKTLTRAPVYCHEEEREMLETPSLNLSTHTGKPISAVAEGTFKDDDTFEVGEVTLRVLHTAGHTPGGVCLYDAENGVLFTGDTLFRSSIGRTDFPNGDHALLVKNITSKLLTLPEETRVFPGHGASTTIASEKKNNPFLREGV
ncbi:MAG: MBL fold metallo-hydrolase [Defluviitaleaceae bacterium]|nr:MBL fold metallo-hydrolase [Defluviitaleaceae bacterium]MCL2273757.1 MBL fold metallo-hydrolase [Defluviitaleaceae bacterium]